MALDSAHRKIEMLMAPELTTAARKRCVFLRAFRERAYQDRVNYDTRIPDLPNQIGVLRMQIYQLKEEVKGPCDIVGPLQNALVTMDELIFER
jgi:hypothetical protein